MTRIIDKENMTLLFYDNDPAIHNGKRDYLRIRNDKAQKLVPEMLMLEYGMPTIVLKSVVDLIAEENYHRAKELLDVLKTLTTVKNTVTEHNHDVLFDSITTLILTEYAYKLMEFNRSSPEDVEQIKNNTRRFAKLHNNNCLADWVTYEDQRNTSLARFNFEGAEAVDLFNSMFVNHLIDGTKLNTALHSK